MRAEPAIAAPHETHSARLQQLLDFFAMVERERMVGVPILNASLSIEAVGFEYAEHIKKPVLADAEPVAQSSAKSSTNPFGDPLQGNDGPMGEGILITPWFMSLIRLPLSVVPGQQHTGQKFIRGFGSEQFDFLGNDDASVGYFESCALFSPMAEFTDQALARETAQQALTQLRQPVLSKSPAIGRRAFLMGRTGGTSGTSGTSGAGAA